MYSSRLHLFIFFLLFSSCSWVHAVCYYPDKSIVPNYQACDPEQVNGSACCELSTSVCTSEGYCFGSAVVIYRGGCTDPDWASPNCAKNCLNGTQPPFKTSLRDPSLTTICVLVAQGLFSNIFPCSSGLFTKIFCCGDVSKTACCDESFKFEAGYPYAPSPFVHDKTSTSTLITYSSTSELSRTSALSTTQISSSILASSNKDLSGTSAPSPIPSAHTASKRSTAIGLGIGLPLGLLLLLSIGFFLWQERQRRIRMEGLMREAQTAMFEMRQRQPHDEYPIVSSTAGPYELQHINRAPGELDSHSSQIYEAAAKRQIEFLTSSRLRFRGTFCWLSSCTARAHWS